MSTRVNKGDSVNYLHTLSKISVKPDNNKNAFRWDAYRPLVDCIPACTAQGGCLPGVGVSAVGSASGLGGGVVSQHAMGQTPPPPVDRQTPGKTLPSQT